MAQTTILQEDTEEFDGQTGEIKRQTKRTVKKSPKLEPTDEFVKVSKYLNVIFAYNNIPLSLVPISLLLAQKMEFKTNVVTLLKDDKEEIAEMLGLSLKRVNDLISMCKQYDIIRPYSRGKYAVNGFLFSTGNAAETKSLQAHFDFWSDSYMATAEQKNLITGQIVKKAVYNKSKEKMQIPGQMSLEDIPNLKTEEDYEPPKGLKISREEWEKLKHTYIDY